MDIHGVRTNMPCSSNSKHIPSKLRQTNAIWSYANGGIMRAFQSTNTETVILMVYYNENKRCTDSARTTKYMWSCGNLPNMEPKNQ